MVALDLDRRLSALARLTTEYRDLPGLRLTTTQAARLCGLTLCEAEAVLTALVAIGHLNYDSSGHFALVDINAQAPDLARAADVVSHWDAGHHLSTGAVQCPPEPRSIRLIGIDTTWRSYSLN